MNLDTYAPSLQKLNLKLDNEQLGSSLIYSLASTSTSWSQLQELQLGWIDMGVEDLSALLHKIQGSLRILKLEGLNIESNDSGDDLRSLFRALGKFPALENIQIRTLWAGAGFVVNKTVGFPAILENPIIDEVRGTRFVLEYTINWMAVKTVSFVSYSGLKMDVALEFLAQTLELV